MLWVSYVFSYEKKVIALVIIHISKVSNELSVIYLARIWAWKTQWNSHSDTLVVNALSPSRVFIVGNDGQQMRLVIIRHLGSEVRTIRDLLITWLILTDASKSLFYDGLKDI